ncbi:hypothetical protein TIFTF001_022517, partial [Ficus carica]
RERERERILR